MKFLSSKKRTIIYMDIATIHIWLTHGDIEDPAEKEDAYNALSEIAMILGGLKGLEFVKSIIRQWKEAHYE